MENSQKALYIRYNVQSMLHVSIIIVNYNSSKDTIECLKSLSKISTTGFKHNILVVDNGSLDELVLPKSLQNNTIDLIRSEANKGFTGGNNLGIYYAIEKYNSDYVLLLNNDTTVDKKFLKNMINLAGSDPRIGMVGSKIFFSKGSEFHRDSYQKSELGNVLWYAGGSIDWKHLVAFHRGVDEVDRGQFDQENESDFITGCSMLVKREVLEKVGVFDKRYFLYLEDVDWSVRTQNAGYKLAFAPDSIVYHKNAGSSGGSGSSIHEYYQTRNRLLFAYKHGSWETIFTAVRLAISYLLFGTRTQRLGVLHAVTLQYGKQPIL